MFPFLESPGIPGTHISLLLEMAKAALGIQQMSIAALAISWTVPKNSRHQPVLLHQDHHKPPGANLGSQASKLGGD